MFVCLSVLPWKAPHVQTHNGLNQWNDFDSGWVWWGPWSVLRAAWENYCGNGSTLQFLSSLVGWMINGYWSLYLCIDWRPWLLSLYSRRYRRKNVSVDRPNIQLKPAESSRHPLSLTSADLIPSGRFILSPSTIKNSWWNPSPLVLSSSSL